jgi:hypothetical protein
MSHKLPNRGIPVPRDYIDGLRHYLPNLPLAAIKDAWLHNATPAEVMAHLERARSTT